MNLENLKSFSKDAPAAPHETLLPKQGPQPAVVGELYMHVEGEREDASSYSLA